jgi:hypothetical protein
MYLQTSLQRTIKDYEVTSENQRNHEEWKSVFFFFDILIISVNFSVVSRSEIKPFALTLIGSVLSQEMLDLRITSVFLRDQKHDVVPLNLTKIQRNEDAKDTHLNPQQLPN